MRVWSDPYGEHHEKDWPNCPWCFIEPRVCEECGELVHNYFIDAIFDEQNDLQVTLREEPHIHRVEGTVAVDAD